jgi:uncharacterized metal-binding protein YceD (DUF177 family)
MLLNLLRIPEGRSVLSQTIVWEDEQSDWLVCPEGLSCTAEIDRLKSQIAVHIVYSGTVMLECSRCLTSYGQPVAGDFHVLLKNRSEEKRLDGDDEDYSDFSFDDATDELDIRDAIFDDVVTGLPMMPLCSGDCPGLLPQNEDSADSSDAGDVRWNALKKLKQQ